MNRTGLSLYYLCGYLPIGGLVLLFFPKQGLSLLLSDGDYGDVFPRVAGMRLTGLGMVILGIISARAEALYPATLIVRAFFLICLVAFFLMTRDPLFLVLFAVVAFGFVLTGLTYLTEKKIDVVVGAWFSSMRVIAASTQPQVAPAAAAWRS
jgi:hypothetical protein